MKSLLILFCLLFYSISSFAQVSQIYSIDDDNSLPPEVNVFEETLPIDLYLQLIGQAEDLNYTPISHARAYELFNTLKTDPRARMKYPGGLCSSRRIHTQKVLRAKNIVSGRLYVSCPGNNGRLRFRDQVSGRFFTYSNFHDTNVVLVNTGAGHSYFVMDLQFQSGPVTLGNYLGQISAYQRLQPAKREDDAGTCYWRL